MGRGGSMLRGVRLLARYLCSRSNKAWRDAGWCDASLGLCNSELGQPACLPAILHAALYELAEGLQPDKLV